MRSDLPKDHITYLRSQIIAVVSTIDKETKKPQSATVFYWINDVHRGEFNLYFVTRRYTRKFHNLMSDPSVSVVVGTGFDPLTVQLEGEAELVESQDGLQNMAELTERLHAHPTLAMIYSGAFVPRNPFPQQEGDDFAVFRVRPSWVRFMRYDQERGELVFDQIKP